MIEGMVKVVNCAMGGILDKALSALFSSLGMYCISTSYPTYDALTPFPLFQKLVQCFLISIHGEMMSKQVMVPLMYCQDGCHQLPFIDY